MLKIKVNESSVTRIMAHLKNYDCGTITAFRETIKDVTDGVLDKVLDYKGKPVPLPVKKAWNRELRASLLKLGYGVTSIKGRYKEDGWDSASDEESFFVVNLTNDPEFVDRMASFGEAYNQDCILIKEQGNDNAYLLGTNLGWPGYGVKENVGKLAVNIPLDAVGASSVIKNKAFAFKKESATDESHNGSQFALDTFYAYGAYGKNGISESAKPLLSALGISANKSLGAYKEAFDRAMAIK